MKKYIIATLMIFSLVIAPSVALADDRGGLFGRQRPVGIAGDDRGQEQENEGDDDNGGARAQGLIRPLAGIGNRDTTGTAPFGGERGRGKGEGAGLGNGAMFCQAIDSALSILDERIAQKEVELGKKQEDKNTKLIQKRAQNDGTRSNNRDAKDEFWGDKYSLLQSKATTDEQKAAVAAFKTAVDTAMTTRRTAVDAAVAAFRAATDGILGTRKSALDAALAKFKTDVDAAKAAAKTACAQTGADSTAIAKTFRDAVKAAQDKLRAATKVTPEIDAQIKAAQDTRKAAIKAADDAFRTAIEKARADLKAVFNK